MSRGRIQLRAWLRHRSAAAANDNDPWARDPGAPPSRLFDYLVLVAVITGVALFYWLAILFVDWDRIQTCVTMGKRTCNPIIELNRQ